MRKIAAFNDPNMSIMADQSILVMNDVNFYFVCFFFYSLFDGFNKFFFTIGILKVIGTDENNVFIDEWNT